MVGRGLELLKDYVDVLGLARQADSQLGGQNNDGKISSSQIKMASRKRNEESSKEGLRWIKYSLFSILTEKYRETNHTGIVYTWLSVIHF